MVPLAPELRAVLEGVVRLRLPHARVVVSERGQTPTRQRVLGAFKRLEHQLGVREWSFHSLRHYFCSALIRRGVASRRCASSPALEARCHATLRARHGRRHTWRDRPALLVKRVAGRDLTPRPRSRGRAAQARLPDGRLPGGLKSGRRDLNPRRRAPKARALPDCATPRGARFPSTPTSRRNPGGAPCSFHRVSSGCRPRSGRHAMPLRAR